MSAEILSLAEAAHFLGLSRITLYRLARKGRIPAQKVGHSWRFDRTGLQVWIRSRRRPNLTGKILEEIKKRVIPLGDGHVRSITLFGSHVRGEATEESDLDLLVLIDSRDPRLEERLHRAAYEVMRRFGFRWVIALTVMTEDHFAQLGRLGYSLYRNLTREGQPLWQAA